MLYSYSASVLLHKKQDIFAVQKYVLMISIMFKYEYNLNDKLSKTN